MNNNNEFVKFVNECNESFDKRMKNVLLVFCKQTGIQLTFGYNNDLFRNKLTIYTKYPGMFIGFHGKYNDLLKELMKKEFLHDYEIEYIEVKGGFIDTEMIRRYNEK